MLHHAKHHATKHGVIILARSWWSFAIRTLGVLVVVSIHRVVLGIVLVVARGGVVAGRSVVVVVVVIRLGIGIVVVVVAFAAGRLIPVAFAAGRILVLVAPLGRLRLRLRLCLRLGVGVLGERPVHRHLPPRDGGAVHLTDGALGVRLGGERREREPLGLAVEVPRHGQVPHEPRLGARRPDILVRRLEREVADDHAPALRLGALAPAELPRPQHGRQRIRRRTRTSRVRSRAVAGRAGLELAPHFLLLALAHAGHGPVQRGHGSARDGVRGVHDDDDAARRAVVPELRRVHHQLGRGREHFLHLPARARRLQSSLGVDPLGLAR